MIPVVRSQETKSFRFSDAELVILPNDKELEIIFFETD
jgi:hypothetical protein